MSPIFHERRWNNRSHRSILLLPRSSDISRHRGGVVTGCVPLYPENMCTLHKQGGVSRLSLSLPPLRLSLSRSLSRPPRPALPSVHSCCWLYQPELRDLPSSAVGEKMQKDSGILSPLSSPLPVREEEPPLRPDVWRHNHEYSGAVLVSEGKINTSEGF